MNVGVSDSELLIFRAGFLTLQEIGSENKGLWAKQVIVQMGPLETNGPTGQAKPVYSFMRCI